MKHNAHTKHCLHALKNSGGVGGGGGSPPPCETQCSHEALFACLNKKREGWGGAQPPPCETQCSHDCPPPPPPPPHVNLVSALGSGLGLQLAFQALAGSGPRLCAQRRACAHAAGPAGDGRARLRRLSGSGNTTSRSAPTLSQYHTAVTMGKGGLKIKPKARLWPGNRQKKNSTSRQMQSSSGVCSTRQAMRPSNLWH